MAAASQSSQSSLRSRAFILKSIQAFITENDFYPSDNSKAYVFGMAQEYASALSEVILTIPLEHFDSIRHIVERIPSSFEEWEATQGLEDLEEDEIEDAKKEAREEALSRQCQKDAYEAILRAEKRKRSKSTASE